MDFSAYGKHLQYTREDDLVDRYIQTAKSFEEFLIKHMQTDSIEAASPGDVGRFDETQDQDLTVRHWRNRHLSALFRYLGLQNLVDVIVRLDTEVVIPAKLSLFRVAPLAHRKALEAIGVFDNLQLLELSQTPSNRQRLATQTGIPLEGLETLIKIADLRRLTGLRRVYALMEAGIDTLKDVAALAPETLFEKVQAAHPKRKLDFGGYRHLPHRAGLLPPLVADL